MLGSTFLTCSAGFLLYFKAGKVLPKTRAKSAALGYSKWHVRSAENFSKVQTENPAGASKQAMVIYDTNLSKRFCTVFFTTLQTGLDGCFIFVG